MGKLYEVLAVEEDLKKTANAVINEASTTFQKKDAHFMGHIKTLTMFDEARQAEADALSETKEVVTTVPEKIEYVCGHIIKHFNAMGQKEEANQRAKANVVLENGDVILEDVPATTLLALERELKKAFEMYQHIPTTAPNVQWLRNDDVRKNTFRASEPIKAHRTEKQLQIVELSPATKEHKAQVHAEKVDRPVGQWVTEMFSGAVSPSRKSEYLDKISGLLRSIKEARMRANEVEVKQIDIGAKLFNYINA